jgi:hypothetical protein
MIYNSGSLGRVPILQLAPAPSLSSSLVMLFHDDYFTILGFQTYKLQYRRDLERAEQVKQIKGW